MNKAYWVGPLIAANTVHDRDLHRDEPLAREGARRASELDSLLWVVVLVDYAQYVNDGKRTTIAGFEGGQEVENPAERVRRGYVPTESGATSTDQG
jgi:hypothetical protein